MLCIQSNRVPNSFPGTWSVPRELWILCCISVRVPHPFPGTGPYPGVVDLVLYKCRVPHPFPGSGPYPGVVDLVLYKCRVPHPFPGTGPYPGVVDLFGTIGGIVEHRAALLASRGFAALALAYFWVDDERGIVTDMEYFEVRGHISTESFSYELESLTHTLR